MRASTSPIEPIAVDAHVRVVGLSKRFGGVHALRDVTVDFQRGRVHALVGENGAGKSTLGKVIAGIHSPNSGDVFVSGERVEFGDTRDALRHGLTTIPQELPLVPGMTVMENVLLGLEPARATVVDVGEQRRRLEALQESTGFDLAGSAPVGMLSIADQQKVAILSALARRAELIVMDEPTAALPRADALHLLDVVRHLASIGTTIVYVSHFLEEVLSVADAVTIMKDGRVVRTGAAQDETPDSLMSAMLGRDRGQQYPDRRPVPEVGDARSLRVRGLTRRDAFRDVSFDVRPGEIVGIAGLVGSGRSEVARAICGADRFDAGEVLVGDDALDASHPSEAIARGVVLIPDSRELGLMTTQSVSDNVAVTSLKLLSRRGVVKRDRLKAVVASAIEAVGIRAEPEQEVATLSGGNQQRVLFARWMAEPPRVVVADEPTRGVDVGAKRGIYDLLVELAAAGMSVVLISNENEELLGMCHRIFVMNRGTIVAELDGPSAGEDEILRAAFEGGPRPEVRA